VGSAKNGASFSYPNSSLWGMCSLAVSGLIAIFSSSLEFLYVVVSLFLFAVGLFLSFRAFAISLARSRYEIITTSDLILLPKGTTQKVKICLYGSLLGQIIISIFYAATQSSSIFAFGILASVFALGNLNMWAIVNGTFKKR